MGIRSRLFLAFLLVALTPIVVLSTLSILDSTRQQEKILSELNTLSTSMQSVQQTGDYLLVQDQVAQIRLHYEQLSGNARTNLLIVSASLVMIGLLLAVMITRNITISFEDIFNKARRAFQATQGMVDEIQPPSQNDDISLVSYMLQAVEMSLAGKISRLERQLGLNAEEARQRAVFLKEAVQLFRFPSSAKDLDSTLHEIIQQIAIRFDFYHAAIYLLDLDGEYAILRAVDRGIGSQRMLQAGYRVKVGREGIVGNTAAGVEEVNVPDIQADRNYIPNINLPAARSELAIPLVVRGHILGVLDVQSTLINDFEQEEKRDILCVIANQLALTLDNFRLAEEAQQALSAERRAYAEITRLGWEALARTRPELGYQANEQGIFRVEGDWQPGMKEALLRGEPVVKQSTDSVTVSMPIRVRDDILGVIDFRKNGLPAEWTDEDMSLIKILADQLGQALESARLYQNARLRAEHERVLSDITAKVRSSTNVNTILQTAIKELTEVLHVSKGIIQLRSGDGGKSDG